MIPVRELRPATTIDIPDFRPVTVRTATNDIVGNSVRTSLTLVDTHGNCYRWSDWGTMVARVIEYHSDYDGYDMGTAHD